MFGEQNYITFKAYFFFQSNDIHMVTNNMYIIETIKKNKPR